MWRAFFFAVGSTLILLGVQTLVVDHIVIANGTRVPGFVAKFLDRGTRSSVKPYTIPTANGNPNFVQRVASGVGVSPQSNPNLSRSNGSLFGPSRFGDSQFSNTNLPRNISYYGGVPFSNRQQPNSNPNSLQQFSTGANGSNPQFSLAGYGGNSAASQAGSVRNGQGNRLSPVTLGRGGSRIFTPADWMPWGFLAIGTLVVLYTNSTGRRYAKE